MCLNNHYPLFAAGKVSIIQPFLFAMPNPLPTDYARLTCMISKGYKLHHCYNTPLHALPRTFNIDDAILMIFVCVFACACFVDASPSMVIITRTTNTGSHLLQLFP